MELLLSPDLLRFYNQDIFAKTGVSVLYDTVCSSNDAMRQVFEAKRELLEKNPGNVVLKNAMDYFVYMLGADIREEAREKHNVLIHKLTEANKEVARLATRKIKAGSTVFVHSINNQMLELLREAGKSKAFTVNFVEHTPFGFGKHMADKLRKEKINCRLYPDLMIREAVTESDTCFLGGEAFSDTGAVAKIGSVSAAEAAQRHNIPVYVCAHTLKYSKDHEKLTRQQYESQYHDVRRVHEHMPAEIISAFICEHGIFKPQHINEEIRLYNNWMKV